MKFAYLTLWGEWCIMRSMYEIERSSMLLREEVINFTSDGGNLYQQAFTSDQFSKRVRLGLRRVATLYAESGFTILSDGHRIFYSPLVLGTGIINPDDPESVKATSASVGGYRWSVDRFILNDDFDNVERIGDFHFHPGYFPFSTTDIVFYTTSIDIDARMGIRKLQNFFGVFMSRYKWDGKKYSPTQATLFMFKGIPENYDYMGANFDRLKVYEQQGILERSGFRTFLIELPVSKGSADLSPLVRELRNV